MWQYVSSKIKKSLTYDANNITPFIDLVGWDPKARIIIQ